MRSTDRGRRKQSAGSSGARRTAAIAVAAAAVQGESPKRRRINNLPWGNGLFLGWVYGGFCYWAFLLGDVLVINVPALPPPFPQVSTPSEEGAVSERRGPRRWWSVRCGLAKEIGDGSPRDPRQLGHPWPPCQSPGRNEGAGDTPGGSPFPCSQAHDATGRDWRYHVSNHPTSTWCSRCAQGPEPKADPHSSPFGWKESKERNARCRGTESDNGPTAPVWPACRTPLPEGHLRSQPLSLTSQARLEHTSL